MDLVRRQFILCSTRCKRRFEELEVLRLQTSENEGTVPFAPCVYIFPENVADQIFCAVTCVWDTTDHDLNWLSCRSSTDISLIRILSNPAFRRNSQPSK